MRMEALKSGKEYDKVMYQIELLLQRATEMGGFEKLSSEESLELKELSRVAEQFEDSLSLMPIKYPTTLTEMIKYKMVEMNLKQKQLAKLLEISEARISELLTGKRKINMEMAKKLHAKLQIDANFILNKA